MGDLSWWKHRKTFKINVLWNKNIVIHICILIPRIGHWLLMHGLSPRISNVLPSWNKCASCHLLVLYKYLASAINYTYTIYIKKTFISKCEKIGKFECTVQVYLLNLRWNLEVAGAANPVRKRQNIHGTEMRRFFFKCLRNQSCEGFWLRRRML